MLNHMLEGTPIENEQTIFFRSAALERLLKGGQRDGQRPNPPAESALCEGAANGALSSWPQQHTELFKEGI
jgi:hypothetical protein